MAETMAELNKDTSGTWEEVQITKLDTSHPYVEGYCYINKALKMAWFTGTVYNGTQAFSGLPKPSVSVKGNGTDTTNKANVVYIDPTGVVSTASGSDPSYYNTSIIYPYASL